jgi:hypothetical protein
VRPVKQDDRIVLRDGELEALMREAHGPLNGRVVNCAFGPSGVWLARESRDPDGNYPQWIMTRLCILRGEILPGVHAASDEHDELQAFAQRVDRPLPWLVVRDADGLPVLAEPTLPPEVVTLFYGGRVRAPGCPHYMTVSERAAGFNRCESCGG